MRPRANFHLQARLRRWFYLITIGMWKGEAAYDVVLLGRVREILAIKPKYDGDFIHTVTRTFYQDPMTVEAVKVVEKRMAARRAFQAELRRDWDSGG